MSRARRRPGVSGGRRQINLDNQGRNQRTGTPGSEGVASEQAAQLEMRLGKTWSDLDGLDE